MVQFAVSGQFRSRDGFNEFTTDVEAPNKNVARERVYANIGSQHSLRRTQIKIDSVRSLSDNADITESEVAS
ncbi:50S ribosomal protein L18Ae [Haloquadratum walsbyi]|jgi:large subunit ribosomal protein LX|uniref:Large ribosomal subunit protein eL20 n=2 Tax=Haloquadratum walsbyi TaxID=293091 RepID=Q18EU9_HALWD|nr:50S ribosomal protein L18Ae [Haloquadratum walsbyi]CAJ53518.1 50S ribosomal protein L20e [Haloquadratum walsbyi DSM 16790]CCC41680.1 50S ribosomal protein L20e [Haloquadratum walsbyi C23]